jgi:hypothetical protein
MNEKMAVVVVVVVIEKAEKCGADWKTPLTEAFIKRISVRDLQQQMDISYVCFYPYKPSSSPSREGKKKRKNE